MHDYYVAHLADGVHVVAITPDQKIVMVRQFRAGSRRDSLETPGGLVEPGEDPRAAGMRELLEETGYAGDPPELLGTLWPNPALLSMRIATVVTCNARRIAEPKPDQSEELAVVLVPVADIPGLIQPAGSTTPSASLAFFGGFARWLAWRKSESSQGSSQARRPGQRKRFPRGRCSVPYRC